MSVGLRRWAHIEDITNWTNTGAADVTGISDYRRYRAVRFRGKLQITPANTLQYWWFFISYKDPAGAVEYNFNNVITNRFDYLTIGAFTGSTPATIYLTLNLHPGAPTGRLSSTLTGSGEALTVDSRVPGPYARLRQHQFGTLGSAFQLDGEIEGQL